MTKQELQDLAHSAWLQHYQSLPEDVKATLGMATRIGSDLVAFTEQVFKKNFYLDMLAAKREPDERQVAHIERLCELARFVWSKKGDSSDSNDGFCQKCTDERERRLQNYENSGVTLDYIGKASIISLIADGYINAAAADEYLEKFLEVK